ncbi:MAG TPA: methyltransferase domain-containing protein [Vicinamibacteria bacterium]|nr:methyltransferase domain-containing protein [Vicinamibacteria bacterium]
MTPETLSLLCDPLSREPLRLVHEAGAPFLVAEGSGRRFPIRDGIPDFLDEGDLEGPNRRYQRLYDRLAAFYDASTWLYALIKRTSEATRRREYLGDLEIQAGDRVLEVSVGTGANLRLLPRGAKYFGLDISRGMLHQCRKRSRRRGLDVELFVGAAERLPFRERVFDCVLHVGGINFFSDRRRAVEEMVRVARPGTKIVIVDETEDFALRHEATPFARAFYGSRAEPITAPADLLPAGMRGVETRLVAGGDLYCLSFRTPPEGRPEAGGSR